MATDRDTPRGDPLDARLREAFAGEPVPGLPPDFEARLARRLAAEGLAPGGGRRPLPARDRRLLGGYWVLAALASVAVVAQVDLGPVPWPAIVAVAVTATGLALPLLALRRAGTL